MPNIGDIPKLKIFRSDILTAQADVLVIPQTSGGQVPINFREFVERSNLYPENDTALGEIDTRGDLNRDAKFKYVMFAVTGNGGKRTYKTVRDLTVKIARFSEMTPDVSVVACTVLGTGNEELNGLDCVKIIAKAFRENSSKEIHIYTNDEQLMDNVDQINTSEFESSPSLRYAFKASVIKSNKNDSLQPILTSTDFYYELAKSKFEEYSAFKGHINTFFEQLLGYFKTAWSEKGNTFNTALDSFDSFSNEYEFLKLCGELVAYIDLNAANKNEWNQYSDKRVIAKANVRQYDWIANLIQFRINDNFNNVSVNISNAIKFLQQPARRLGMLSNRHRTLLLKNIYGNDYQDEQDLNIIFNQFELWGIKPNNPINAGSLFTRILYLDDVEALWNQDPVINDKNDENIFPGNLESVGTPVIEPEQTIEPIFLTDYYAKVDQLNYGLYATAIVAFMKHKNTQAPLTIGIMAPWGKGKTSLMHFIKKRFDAIKPLPKHETTRLHPVTNDGKVTFKLLKSWLTHTKENFEYEKTLQYPTVWFNAWKFQKNEQIWAGFAHEIIHQLVGQLPDALAREEFWLRLNLKRIDQEKLRNKIHFKILNKALIAFVGLVAGLISIFLSFLFKAPIRIGWLTYFGFPAATIIYLICSLSKINAEKIDLDIEKFLKQPDYVNKRGYFHEVEDDLKDVMKMLVAKDSPAVIFIDDLDRCSPNTVAEVVEAINLFISGDFPECYFILGQDAQMVAASLDVAYGKVSENAVNLYREQGSLGWHFMEKFVQLQFCIPTLNENQAKAYFSRFFHKKNTGKVIDSELDEQVQELEDKINSTDKIVDILSKETSSLEEKLLLSDPLKANELQEKIIEKAASEYDDNDPSVAMMIEKLAPYIGTSPRSIKRFINLYRFYKFLQLTNRNTLMENTSSEHLSQWMIIMVRWPQLVRAIQWQSNDEIITGNNIWERSVNFENLFFQYGSYNEWLELVSKDAPKSIWLKDKELYQFMHFMKNDENSLKNAIQIGLW